MALELHFNYYYYSLIALKPVKLQRAEVAGLQTKALKYIYISPLVVTIRNSDDKRRPTFILLLQHRLFSSN